MKKFLEDLKKELVKQRFSANEIEEILEDHKEMIESAQNDGVSDDEIVLKFGDPQKLAKELKDNNNYTNIGGEEMEGFNLLNTFMVSETTLNVTISLVSEDVIYEMHDLPQIEVYQRNIADLDLYEISLKGSDFVLKRKSSKSIFSIKDKSGDFLVRVPNESQYKTVQFVTVSGDAEIKECKANEFIVKSTSGDLEVDKFEAKEFSGTTVSGDLELTNGIIGKMTLSVVSGDIEMEGIECSGPVDINSVSGDVEAENCTVGPLNFKSVSGDLEGKEFYPTTISLRSVSGDLKIDNQNKNKEIEVLSKKSVSGRVKIL